MAEQGRWSQSTNSDWSFLPEDLLKIICSKIRYESHLVRFRSVCKSWQSVEFAPNFVMPFAPLLMMKHRRRQLMEMALSYGEMVDKVNLPSKYLFLNFTQGWMVFTGKSPPNDIVLFNPYSSQGGLQVRPLPPLFPLSTLRKVVASSDPCDEKNCIFLAISTNKNASGLAFCIAGGKWQVLNAGMGFEDITFHNNHVYALHYSGKVYAWNHFTIKDDSIPIPKVVAPSIKPSFGYPTTISRYLVEEEESGNLVQVCATSPFHKFRIFKLNFDTGDWNKVASLGDNSLLLSPYNCHSVSTKDFPNLRSNCINYLITTVRPNEHTLRSLNLKTGWRKVVYRIRGYDPSSLWFIPFIP